MVKDLVLGPRAMARGLFNPACVTRLAEEHRNGSRLHTDRLWLLMNIELWQRLFIDGEETAASSYGSTAEAAVRRS